jgi:hypothetical protein
MIGVATSETEKAAKNVASTNRSINSLSGDQSDSAAEAYGKPDASDGAKTDRSGLSQCLRGRRHCKSARFLRRRLWFRPLFFENSTATAGQIVVFGSSNHVTGSFVVIC